MIPKNIFLSYKKLIPFRVLHMWKILNPDYKIEFSLDSECVSFMNKYFSPAISKKFNDLELGCYKCDLWRLCKLYIYGGVYADVDLVPHMSIDDITLDRFSFYSCLSSVPNSIFQALLITTPRNPIILSCIISFMANRPETISLGPTKDMYNVLQYIYKTPILSDIPYITNTIPIKINIGSSTMPYKIIDLFVDFPKHSKIILEYNKTSNKFTMTIYKDRLIVRRIDKKEKWFYNHVAYIIINSPQSTYLYKEEGPNNADMFVSYKNQRVCNSRCPTYTLGWG